MAERETFKTGRVVLVYPKVSKPDTYGPKADGKFKTQFQYRTADGSYDAEKTAKVQGWLKSKAKELLPKTKTPKYPWKLDEETSEITFRCASKYRPLVVDSKNTKLPEDVLIGGGTEANLGLALNAFDGRLSMYFNEAQILKLVEYQRKERSSSFEAVEGGFVFEGSSAEAASDEETTDAEEPF